ncbi:reticulon-1-A isoform X2 [Drosophila willistoni]|nr:reticulon-1-A isoform X2 [Drosophila willistoni]
MAIKKDIEEFKDKESGNKLKDIILWTNWRKTFLIFSLILISLVYLHVRSVITVISELGLSILTVTTLHRSYIAYMRLVKKVEVMDPYSQYLDVDLSISLTQADILAKSIAKYFKAFFTKMQSLVVMDKLWESLEVFVGLWLLSLFGNYIQFHTLLLAAWITLFTLPKLYDWQKPFFDVQIENLQLLRAVLKRMVMNQLTTIKNKLNCKNQAIAVERVQMGNQLPEANLEVPN